MLSQADYATLLTYEAYGTAPPPEPKTVMPPIPSTSPTLLSPQEALKKEAALFPGQVLVGSLGMFFLIYWFLIRR